MKQILTHKATQISVNLFKRSSDIKGPAVAPASAPPDQQSAPSDIPGSVGPTEACEETASSVTMTSHLVNASPSVTTRRRRRWSRQRRQQTMQTAGRGDGPPQLGL